MVGRWILVFLFAMHSTAHGRVVLGVCEPIIDLIYHVDESVLLKNNMEPGGSLRMDYASFKALQNTLAPALPKVIPGGSGANTLKGLAKLGQKCRFIGKIGHDSAGDVFVNSLLQYKIVPHILLSEKNTTQLISLVTKNGQRTMRCCIGASSDLDVSELSLVDFEGIEHLHMEGYLLYNFPVFLRAIQFAKHMGATVSLDLASFEVVKRFRIELAEVLSKYIDVVIANEQEAFTLTGLHPESACREMQIITPVAVVLVGSEGCWIGSSGKVIHVSTTPVEVVDTTGAGDLFASGFIHGYLEGFSLEKCGELGNLLGSTCVTVDGCEIPEHRWEKILSSASLAPK